MHINILSLFPNLCFFFFFSLFDPGLSLNHLDLFPLSHTYGVPASLLPLSTSIHSNEKILMGACCSTLQSRNGVGGIFNSLHKRLLTTVILILFQLTKTTLSFNTSQLFSCCCSWEIGIWGLFASGSHGHWQWMGGTKIFHSLNHVHAVQFTLFSFFPLQLLQYFSGGSCL